VYSMFFLGGNLVSRLIWTLKSKKTLKILKTFSKKPTFFPSPDMRCQTRSLVALERALWASHACISRHYWQLPCTATPAAQLATCVCCL